MSGGPVGDALVFLINTLFGLYLLAVVLRFLLAWVRADFYNPISQALVKVTNPPLRLLRRFIPGYGGIDWPSLVLMLGLKMLELELIGIVQLGRPLRIAGVLVLAVAELFQLVIYIFLFAIIVQVIISWVSPGAYNPLTVLIYRLTDPMLRPAQRLAPPIGGIDLSPLVVVIVLQLTLILIVNPMLGAGARLA